MDFLITGITFLIVLSILVFVHELGHFLVARRIGVAVEEFGFGLPPRIIGKKIHGTIYSLNWLPIGGFVRLAGEDDGEEGHASEFTQKNAKHLFWARSKKERAAILLAGVCMNFLLAVVVSSYLLTQGVSEPVRVYIDEVTPNSPAQMVGLQKGDTLRAVTFRQQNGDIVEKRIVVPRDLITIANTHRGEEITLTIERNKQTHRFAVVPRKEVPQNEGPIGIALLVEFKTISYPWYIAPVQALKLNLLRVGEMIAALRDMFVRLVTLQPVGEDVAGPIGIAQVTGEAVKYGFRAVLEITSILSLNLAVLNILPIPALDGGRLAFVFAEKLLGKRAKPAFERSAHQIGMIILIALILLVSLNDILRLTRGS